MSETKHTFEPWKFDIKSGCIISTKTGRDIFHLCDDDTFVAINTLQAAAPGMLAALEDAREALNKPPFINSQTLKCIDAAIAAAKGGAK